MTRQQSQTRNPKLAIPNPVQITYLTQYFILPFSPLRPQQIIRVKTITMSHLPSQSKSPEPLPNVPGPKLKPFTRTARATIKFVEEIGDP